MRNAGLEEAQAGIKKYQEPQICRWYHPYGTKQRGTKEPLNESEIREWKNWLKAQHSENKDHGILSHHFMGNRWGNSGNSDRLYFVGSKIPADDDFSHEIKRWLLLGGKAMTNLDSILKSSHYFWQQRSIYSNYVLPVVMYGFESWTIKKSKHQRIDAFEL